MNKSLSSLFFLFVCLLLICIIGILLWGETPWPQVWLGIQHRFWGISQGWNPLLDERLPRLLVLLCTGASLAISGMIMQALFQNPLAAPSVLGISQGGCLLAITIFVFNKHLTYPYLIPLATISGSLLTLCAVYLLARWQKGLYVNNLILTGIAIATLLLSIEGGILYALRDRWQLIQMITEWQGGSSLDRSWKHVHMQLPLTLIGLWGAWIYRKEMNILALGDEEALNLGVDVYKIRWRLVLCTALLTGGALAAMGTIAFFGLILPHLLRRLQGSDHCRLVPLCMIAGGTLLAAIDLILRLFAVQALSIGNFSAITGGFLFLILLFRHPTYRESSDVTSH